VLNLVVYKVLGFKRLICTWLKPKYGCEGIVGLYHTFFDINSTQNFLTLYCSVVILWTTGFNIQKSYVVQHSALMCFVCITEQTDTVSVHNINRLAFCYRDRVCLLRSTSWVFICNLDWCWYFRFQSIFSNWKLRCREEL